MATAHFLVDRRDELEFLAPAVPWLVHSAGTVELALSAVAITWRYDRQGGLQVALVKRRRQGDWGFPKGAPLPGESLEAAARRELLEETGITGRHSAPLANIVYVARSGRTKLATYWLLRAGPGTFRPNHEVTTLTWLAAADARQALSQERERLALRLGVESLGLDGLAG